MADDTLAQDFVIKLTISQRVALRILINDPDAIRSALWAVKLQAAENVKRTFIPA